jgi:hypothetical protein
MKINGRRSISSSDFKYLQRNSLKQRTGNLNLKSGKISKTTGNPAGQFREAILPPKIPILSLTLSPLMTQSGHKHAQRIAAMRSDAQQCDYSAGTGIS